MEKLLEYTPPTEQSKIKKEPESLLKRAKNIVNNFSRSMQKPERTSIQQGEKNSAQLPKGIIEPTENTAGKKEVKDFGDILADKLNSMNRRRFLKVAGTAIGLGLTYEYFKNDIDKLWEEYHEKIASGSIEIEYSKELTKLYEEVHKMPEKKKENTDLQVGKGLAEKLFEYPQKIKNSEKQSLDEFAKDLSQKEFDNLIIGEWHGPGPTNEKAVYILEGLVKNNKKISAICFEGLTYTNPADIEATDKFNRGGISPQEMTKHARLTQKPLLEFARNHSIEIIGLEKDTEENAVIRSDWFGRFKEISQRIGEINREKKKEGKEGIVVTYIGQQHTTIDGWSYLDVIDKLYKKGKTDEQTQPAEKIALENSYTIKEYLEKSKFKPVVLQIDDWEKLTYLYDGLLARWFEDLPEKDKNSFYEFCKNNRQNYGLGPDAEGIYPYPNGKENTFSDIINIPPKFPEKPPVLNGYKYAYDNPYLAEILQELDGIGNVEISQNLILKVKGLPIVEVDKNTGNVTKMYLPEQARKK